MRVMQDAGVRRRRRRRLRPSLEAATCIVVMFVAAQVFLLRMFPRFSAPDGVDPNLHGDVVSDSVSSSRGSAHQPALGGPPRDTLLVIHEGPLQPDVYGCDVRLGQVVEAALQEGMRVAYCYRFGPSDPELHGALQLPGVDVYGPILSSDLVHVPAFRDMRVSIALLMTWYWDSFPLRPSIPREFAPALRAIDPCTFVVVASDDIHFLRESMMGDAMDDQSHRDRARTVGDAEREDVGAGHALVAVSLEDAKRMETHFRAKAGLLPLAATGCATLRSVPGPKHRSGYLFVGNFYNPVNALSLRFLVKEVWPQLRNRVRQISPGAKLHVIGDAGPVSLDELKRMYRIDDEELWTDVELHGHVPDMTPYLDAARVFVSPIVAGTGINTKNIHALCRGLPVVTTTIGSEGLRLAKDQKRLDSSQAAVPIADDAEEIVQAAVHLTQDDALWSNVQKNSLEHMAREFRLESVRDGLRELRRSSNSHAHLCLSDPAYSPPSARHE